MSGSLSFRAGRSTEVNASTASTDRLVRKAGLDTAWAARGALPLIPVPHRHSSAEALDADAMTSRPNIQTNAIGNLVAKSPHLTGSIALFECVE